MTTRNERSRASLTIEDGLRCQVHPIVPPRTTRQNASAARPEKHAERHVGVSADFSMSLS
jgi:hypothetical protein